MKNKYLVVAGVSLGIVALAAGGFVIFHISTKTRLGSLQKASASVDSVARGSGSSGIPLTPTGPAPPDPNSLKVNSSNASSGLSQLSGNQQTTSAGTGSGSPQGSGAGSGSSSGATIDPSTFSQYDKYKSDPTALFGDVQAGTGTELTAGHKAAVYYRGWLTSGQLFDESKAGSDGKLQAFVFTLGDHQVISGWEQGLAGMKVGGVRLLIVPPSVGYGADGQGSIPPNAVLVFQVQLLEVQ